MWGAEEAPLLAEELLAMWLLGEGKVNFLQGCDLWCIHVPPIDGLMPSADYQNKEKKKQKTRS
ncbi:hypothetical protein I79_014642 [Cricetulus griseus]|uniref:Uncharacterized protein n=1 Tax=Cricetulus griseus TaxID=10029 RepID=G3HUN0_CRIGR|nr:hypothetical protein I79_014642 [Cricetulus griseus]